MRSVLLLSLAVAVAAPAALAQDAASCGFDYVVEGGLIAEAFSEVPLTPVASGIAEASWPRRSDYYPNLSQSIT